MGASDFFAKRKVGPGILSLPGRVLMCLLDDTEITRLALSLLLGVSESAIDKAIGTLENENLIEVRRNGRKSRYIIDVENLGSHPDYLAIMAMRINVNNQAGLGDPRCLETRKNAAETN
jgi:DNA-binding transcriptional ArsR family regulator